MANSFPGTSLDPAFRMHTDGVGTYWFYHKGSFPLDQPLLYQFLISNAKSHVKIWDPYFNVQTVNGDQIIFSAVQPEITINILTTRKQLKSITDLPLIHNSLRMVIPPAQKVKFGLRVINRADATQEHFFFHDRFLIVDEKDVYLIGSSIGWHLVSQESTGILRIENVVTRDFIKSLFAEYWNQAHKYKIPEGFLHP